MRDESGVVEVDRVSATSDQSGEATDGGGGGGSCKSEGGGGGESDAAAVPTPVQGRDYTCGISGLGTVVSFI